MDIQHSDGLHYLSKIPKNSVDLIITDPPYITSSTTGMGNLYKQTIRKPRRPVTCPFDMCACGPDLRITKYRGNRYD